MYVCTVKPEFLQVFLTLAIFGTLPLASLRVHAQRNTSLSLFSTWRFFSREQAKSECDWLVMSSVFVTSQSSCFFLCSREQIRLVENRFYTSVVVCILVKLQLKSVFQYANLFARTEKKAT